MRVEEASNTNTVPEIYRELEYFVEKVHVRGVDSLSTEDVTSFAVEHYPAQEPVRVEWIDDTSANITYASATFATEALNNFAATREQQSNTSPDDQLREAKKLSSHPSSYLQVRPAKITDVKKPRAHEASRFYLLNPDKDPREQARRYDGRFRRRGRDGPRLKRGRTNENVQFDVNMYDDDEDSLAKRRTSDSSQRQSRSSFNSDDSRRIKRMRSNKGHSGDLFASKMEKEGRLRDRSASPAVWDGDGRYGFNENNTGHIDLRRESPPAYRKHAANGSTGSTDLFASPSRGRSNAILDENDLFATKGPSTTNNKELFPRSGSLASNHRRTDAFDYSDDTVDLYDRTHGASVQLKESSAQKGLKSRSLADRITGGPLKRKANEEKSNADSFNIRGATKDEENPGFSIKGVAKNINPRVRELFPERESNNSGKELFGGSRAPRKKAEDLFS